MQQQILKLTKGKMLNYLTGRMRAEMPITVDERQWCPPVEDQGDLGFCRADAGVGLVEYFERRAYGKHLDASNINIKCSLQALSNFLEETMP